MRATERSIRHLRCYRLGFSAIIACAIMGMTNFEARSSSYTLEDCIAIGLERSSRLQNALREERIADTTIAQVRSRVMPQLSANASYTRLDELEKIDFGETSTTIGSLNNYAGGIELQQLLYSGGSVRAGLQASRDYGLMTFFQTARIRAELVRDIRSQFADLILLESVVGVHDRSVSQWRDLVERTEARFHQDQAAEFELLSAKVQLANALPGLIRARNDWSAARLAFMNLIGLEDSDFRPEGKLVYESFNEPLDNLIHNALEHRPEMEVLRQRLALQSADIRVEQGAYKPTLHIVGGYSGRNPSGMIADGNDWDWGWRVGLQAQWNWFDGGNRRQRILMKHLERDQIVESLAALRRDLALEVRQASLRIEHAAAAVKASGETESLAAKALEIARSRYEHGLTTRLEYADAGLALMQARLNRLQALRDHHHAVNDIRHAVGSYAR